MVLVPLLYNNFLVGQEPGGDGGCWGAGGVRIPHLTRQARYRYRQQYSSDKQWPARTMDHFVAEM